MTRMGNGPSTRAGGLLPAQRDDQCEPFCAGLLSSSEAGRLGRMHVRKIALAGTVLALALPGTALADFSHLVEPGETLSSIADADGLSITALAAANGLSPQSELQAGQIVQIPPQGAVAAAVDPSAGSLAGSASPAPVGARRHPGGVLPRATRRHALRHRRPRRDDGRGARRAERAQP